jgi:hypothetical protein
MKTVFILGAGASHEFGYPLGSELKQRILDGIAPGNELFVELKNAGCTEVELARLRRGLVYGERDTIDDFIAAHKRDPDLQSTCRKAIVLAISKCESEAKLFGSGYHWYKRLLVFLRRHPRFMKREHFQFITFNYDRSLEHYLYRGLTHGGGELPENFVEEFLLENFYHIHGHVGFLDWHPSSVGHRREYALGMNREMINDIAPKIATPTEGTHLPTELKASLQSADFVNIMGFGFHQSNLEKIGFDDFTTPNRKKPKVRSTVKGLDASFVNVLKMKSVEPVEADCTHLIQLFLKELDPMLAAQT